MPLCLDGCASHPDVDARLHQFPRVEGDEVLPSLCLMCVSMLLYNSIPFTAVGRLLLKCVCVCTWVVAGGE